MKLRAYIDGASRGNPGPAALGVIIKDERGQMITEIGQFLGDATNNVAEYRALLACLDAVENLSRQRQDGPPEELIVFTDSELLVRQVRGDFRVRQPHLRELHHEVMARIRSLPYPFRIELIDRLANREADRLAHRTLNLQSM